MTILWLDGHRNPVDHLSITNDDVVHWVTSYDAFVEYLDDAKFAHTIHNNGSLVDLRNEVRAFVEKYSL